MSRETIRVAVAGAGFWATEMHLPALTRLPGVAVTAVAAGTADSAKAAAQKFGVPRWTDDYAELIADDVDLVDIVTPNHLHAPIAIAAANAGKHVICIKPLAVSLAEADAMAAAAEANGVRLFYAENVPFIPALQRTKLIVDAGAIGEVFRLKACEGIPGPHSAWFFDRTKSGGGVMIDMAVHSVAFCRFFAGCEVESVYAEVGTFVHGDRTRAEDTAVLTLRFANGAIGQCEDSWSLAGAMDSRFELFGTKGRVLIDNLHRQPIQVVSNVGYEPDGARGWSYPFPIPGDIADGHSAMLTHFLDCLRDGTPSGSEAEDGRVILAVVEAAAASVQSGRRELVSKKEERT
jgi:predicted dehydrogenase